MAVLVPFVVTFNQLTFGLAYSKSSKNFGCTQGSPPVKLILTLVLKSGIDELIFTRKYEKEFLDKMKLLSNLPATKYTRASDFVEQIARETKKLLDKGEAYQTDEGIFLKMLMG